MQSGSGAPSNSVGNNGDLYHRTDVPQLYGPKTSTGWPATYSVILGKGCTTAYHIDWDCDGYGVGGGVYDPNPLFGPDADDNDPTVNTPASALAKYGTLDGILAASRDGHAGYTGILRYWAISPAGNDSTCVGGTSAQALVAPCASFAHLQSSLQAGDVVVYRGGTYNLSGSSALPSGTSSNPILVVAYPGEQPSINTGGANGFSFVGSSYITIDGFHIYDSGSYVGTGYGLNGGGPVSNHTIRNCWVHDMGDNIIDMDGLSSVLIERNVLYNGGVGDGHDMYLGSRTHPSSNVTVRQNIMYNADSTTFQFNGRVTNLVLDSNILHSGEGAGISLLEGVSNSFVTNNLSFNHSSAAFSFLNYDDPTCSTAGICPYDQTGNTIENNTFWQGQYDRNRAAAGDPTLWVQNATAALTGNLGGNTYRNNIIYAASGYSGYAPIYFAIGTNSTELATSTFTNNVILNAGTTNALWFNPTGAGGGGTLYNCTQFATVSTVSGCINADPLLSAVSPSYYNTVNLFDFHLKSGSPAIGAGTAAGEPTTDITGTTRPTPPSIGAYDSN
jgi:hypothetical protein